MAFTAIIGCLSGTSEIKILRPLGNKLSWNQIRSLRIWQDLSIENVSEQVDR